MNGPQPIDRSLAFTALLEFEWFRKTESRAGENVVTAFLDYYYGLCATAVTEHRQPPNMFEEAREWGAVRTEAVQQPASAPGVQP